MLVEKLKGFVDNDKRINFLNSKNGTVYFIVLLSFIPFYFYIFFIKFYEKLYFETGICESCSGILIFIQNPIPGILFVLFISFTFYFFPKVFRNDFVDYYEKGKKIGEIKFDNGDVYFGQVFISQENEVIPEGRGYLTKSNGQILRGIWRDGILDTKN